VDWDNLKIVLLTVRLWDILGQTLRGRTKFVLPRRRAIEAAEVPVTEKTTMHYLQLKMCLWTHGKMGTGVSEQLGRPGKDGVFALCTFGKAAAVSAGANMITWDNWSVAGFGRAGEYNAR
jgi:hypothetical protein